MTMVERVALAIQEQMTSWLTEDGTVNDEDLAIAAITAMREPSEGMLCQAGIGLARPCWEVMIDAALAEADLPTDAIGVE